MDCRGRLWGDWGGISLIKNQVDYLFSAWFFSGENSVLCYDFSSKNPCDTRNVQGMSKPS
jgi:hypothetical protein